MMRTANILGLSLVVLCGLLLTGAAAQESGVALKISGPGAINDSTIKAGEQVDFDIYMATDVERTGFSLGFAFTSPNIESIEHVNDSGKGLNEGGDIKGHNAWKDKSVFDFFLGSVERDWDGQLPELVGFGGLSAKQSLPPIDYMKAFSISVKVPDTGTLVVDSAFFPPAGKWLYSPPADQPKWGGPYKFQVIK